MDEKAQGAFEYILLLAGVLLIVVLAIIILRGSVLNQGNQQIVSNINQTLYRSNASNPANLNLAAG